MNNDYKINIKSDWFNYIYKEKNINYNIDIYVDNVNYEENENKKILIMIEPCTYLTNVYDFVIENFNKFDIILTHNKNILKFCPNACKVLFGTTWVNKNLNVDKLNKISFLIGGKNFLPGHQLRHLIYENQLKIKDNYLNIFISKNYPIKNNLFNNSFLNNDKNELFKNFRYHLCIENCDDENYFSEKLIDCFQTMTVPIYWGCKNISKYFFVKGMILLNDCKNIDETIKKINSINLEKFYIYNIKYIRKNYYKSNQYIKLRHEKILNKFIKNNCIYKKRSNKINIE